MSPVPTMGCWSGSADSVIWNFRITAQAGNTSALALIRILDIIPGNNARQGYAHLRMSTLKLAGYFFPVPA